MDLELGIICSELAKWGYCGLTMGIFAYVSPLALLTGFTFNCEEAHVDGLGPFVFVYFPMIGFWFLGDTVYLVAVASSVVAITPYIPTILLFRYGMALFYACAIFYAGSIQVKNNLQNDSAIHELMGHDQEENYEASMECPNAPHTYDYEETVALLEAYLGRLEREKYRTLIVGLVFWGLSAAVGVYNFWRRRPIPKTSSASYSTAATAATAETGGADEELGDIFPADWTTIIDA